MIKIKLFSIYVVSALFVSLGTSSIVHAAIDELPNPCIPAMVMLGEDIIPFNRDMVAMVAIPMQEKEDILFNPPQATRKDVVFYLKNGSRFVVFSADRPLSKLLTLDNGKILAFDDAARLHLLNDKGLLQTRTDLVEKKAGVDARVAVAKVLRNNLLIVSLVENKSTHYHSSIKLLDVSSPDGSVKVVQKYEPQPDQSEFYWSLAGDTINSVLQLDNGLVALVLGYSNRVVFIDPEHGGRRGALVLLTGVRQGDRISNGGRLGDVPNQITISAPADGVPSGFMKHIITVSGDAETGFSYNYEQAPETFGLEQAEAKKK